MTRDPELYFFSVFGTPAAKGTWGYRVEGHHLSLHYVVGKRHRGCELAGVFRHEPGRGA